jgi:hypothetical protein
MFLESLLLRFGPDHGSLLGSSGQDFALRIHKFNFHGVGTDDLAWTPGVLIHPDIDQLQGAACLNVTNIADEIAGGFRPWRRARPAAWSPRKD